MKPFYRTPQILTTKPAYERSFKQAHPYTCYDKDGKMLGYFSNQMLAARTVVKVDGYFINEHNTVFTTENAREIIRITK